MSGPSCLPSSPTPLPPSSSFNSPMLSLPLLPSLIFLLFLLSTFLLSTFSAGGPLPHFLFLPPEERLCPLV